MPPPTVIIISSAARLHAHEKGRGTNVICLGVNLATIWSSLPTILPGDDEVQANKAVVEPLAIWNLAPDSLQFHVALFPRGQESSAIFAKATVIKLSYPSAELPPIHTAVGDKIDKVAASILKNRVERDQNVKRFAWQSKSAPSTTDDENKWPLVTFDSLLGHLSTQAPPVPQSANLSYVITIDLTKEKYGKDSDHNDKPLTVERLNAEDFQVCVAPEFLNLGANWSDATPSQSSKLQTESAWFGASDADRGSAPGDMQAWTYEPIDRATPLVCFAGIASLARPAGPFERINPTTQWILPPEHAGNDVVWSESDWLTQLPGKLADAFDPVPLLFEAVEKWLQLPGQLDANRLNNLGPLLVSTIYVGLQDQRVNPDNQNWRAAINEIIRPVEKPAKRALPVGGIALSADAIYTWLELVKQQVAAALPGNLLLQIKKPKTPSDPADTEKPPEPPTDVASAMRYLAYAKQLYAAVAEDETLREVTTNWWAAFFNSAVETVTRAQIRESLATYTVRRRIGRDRVEQKPFSDKSHSIATGNLARPPQTIWRAVLNTAALGRSHTADEIAMIRSACAAELTYQLTEYTKDWIKLTPAASESNLIAVEINKIFTGRSMKLVDRLFPQLADPTVPKVADDERRSELGAPSPIVLQIDSVVETTADQADLFRQFTGVGLLLRRANRKDVGIGGCDWTCLNMARLDWYTLGDADTPSDPALVPLAVSPYRMSYSNGVRTALISYDNAPLVARSHLARAASSEDTKPLDSNAVLEHRLQLRPSAVKLVKTPPSVRNDSAPLSDWAKLPALLFGFEYDALPFVIGNSGALPAELVEESGHPAFLAQPVNAVLKALDELVDKQAWKIRYFRRTPVGAPRVTYQPPGSPTHPATTFPPIPPDIRPLAADVLHSDGMAFANDTQQTGSPLGVSPDSLLGVPGSQPILLLAPPLEEEKKLSLEKRRTFARRDGFISRATLLIRPPTADLQTWDRWVGADIALATGATRERLSSRRENTWLRHYKVTPDPAAASKFRQDRDFDDPAVAPLTGPAQLNITWQKKYPASATEAHPLYSQTFLNDDNGEVKPFELRIERGEQAGFTSVEDQGIQPVIPGVHKPGKPDGRGTLTLTDGVWEVRVSCPIAPIHCQEGDARRFGLGVFPEKPTEENGPIPKNWPLEKDCRSAESVFYVELAPALAVPSQVHPTAWATGDEKPKMMGALVPTSALLWEKMTQSFEADHVRLTMTLPDPKDDPTFAFVVRAEVRYQFWRWNGQPMPQFPNAKTLPPKLDPPSDPTVSGATDYTKWEVSAFSDRADDDAQAEQSPVPFRSGELQLLSRSVAGDARAHYVRVGMRVFGRYPGMPLADFDPIWASRLEPHSGPAPKNVPEDLTDKDLNTLWKRVLVPYRPAEALAAPAVRLAVPLLRGLKAEPELGINTKQRHAIAVVVDEAWFDRAGIAESLQAEVCFSKYGPTDMLEFGPDPIVSIDDETLRDTLQGRQKSVVLDAYGPVGHTFDFNVLAPRVTASTFLLTVDRPTTVADTTADPADWAFIQVRFSRCAADLPSVPSVPTPVDSTHASPWTAPIWLQLLPHGDMTPLAFRKPDRPLLAWNSQRDKAVLVLDKLEAEALKSRVKKDGRAGFEWWVLFTQMSASAVERGRDESYVAVARLNVPKETTPPTDVPPLEVRLKQANMDGILFARVMCVQVTRVAGEPQPLVLEPDMETAEEVTKAFWDALFGESGGTTLENGNAAVSADAPNGRDVRGRIVTVSQPAPATKAAVRWLAAHDQPYGDEPDDDGPTMPPSGPPRMKPRREVVPRQVHSVEQFVPVRIDMVEDK